MPRITVQLFEGRTTEQKRAAVEGITRVICETCDTQPDHVTIVFEEMKHENHAKGGVLGA